MIRADNNTPIAQRFEWLEARTKWLYDGMVAVRDAPLVVAGNRPTVDMMPGTNPALGVLVRAGFKPAEGLQVFFVLGGYVGGMALEAQATAARDELSPESQEAMREALTSEQFPYLRENANGETSIDPQTVFEYGLDLLLRGIRARHAEL